MVDGIAAAYDYYGKSKSSRVSRTAVLMVVQPNNMNVSDERPFQEALWARDIPCYRIEFGFPVLASTDLTDSGELLHRPFAMDENDLVEVAVVYHRAGYNPNEYTEVGLECRYQLEKSWAIKCPSILCHLATLKVVQQKLAMPQILERYLSPAEADLIRATFMPMYPLDGTDLGKEARQLAMNVESSSHYVLKPSLEGGGHNVYRGDIPEYLRSIPPEQWDDYILMEMIRSPDVTTFLTTPMGFYDGLVISELGIFGICMWRAGHEGIQMLQNSFGGSSLKTKKADINEMSVIKGYGCFDSPCFVRAEQD